MLLRDCSNKSGVKAGMCFLQLHQDTMITTQKNARIAAGFPQCDQALIRTAFAGQIPI